MRRIDNERNCANCYYGDKCPDEKVCKFYDPLDAHEVLLEEYLADLETRHKEYIRGAGELGGDDY